MESKKERVESETRPVSVISPTTHHSLSAPAVTLDSHITRPVISLDKNKILISTPHSKADIPMPRSATRPVRSDITAYQPPPRSAASCLFCPEQRRQLCFCNLLMHLQRKDGRRCLGLCREDGIWNLCDCDGLTIWMISVAGMDQRRGL